MTKNLRLVSLLVLIVGVSAVVALAGAPLNFKDLKGPAQILFGPLYTYSAIVEGSYKEIGWSATGGKVQREWWDGNQYFCEVQWVENKPDDPAKIKVWGKDESGQDVAERLFVTLQAGKRSIGYKSVRSEGGKCLEVNLEDLVKNGGKVQVWECNNQIQQHWKLDGEKLVNEGGKCLDVDLPQLTKDGGKVQVFDCNGQIQQKWKLDEHDRLVNAGGKCLDVDINQLTKDGGTVQIWQCHKEKNQRWKFVE